MKKFLIVLALASVSLTSMAQEDPTLKYSVATNSFWSNWFATGSSRETLLTQPSILMRKSTKVFLRVL